MTSRWEGIAGWLRTLADRIDPDGAPRMSGWSFTFENERGMVLRETTNQGCPLWYLGEADYRRAHAEADTEHAIVDWVAGTARFGR